MNKLPAVVVNASNVMALSVIRSLGRKKVPVVCLFGKSDRPKPFQRIVASSRYIYRSYFFDESDSSYEESLISALVNVGERADSEMILLPVSDEDMILISKHRGRLERFYRMQMPAHFMLECLLNKDRFYKLAVDHGLPIPRTVVIEKGRSTTQCKEWGYFPCIVKPPWRNRQWEKVFGRRKVIMATTRKDLLEIIAREDVVARPLVIQEIISGPDSSIFCSFAYLDQRSEAGNIFVCRKIRQYPPYFGNTAMAEGVAEPVIENLSRDIYRQLKLIGYVSIEFKKDHRDGAYRILEITASRLNRQAGLAVVSGLDLPYIWYTHFTEEEKILPVLKLKRKWISEVNEARAFYYYLSRGDWSILSWLKSYANVKGCEIFSRDDLKPFLYFLVKSLPGIAFKRSSNPSLGLAGAD